MPSKKDKTSLKAFWKAVERRLGTASADELRTILRAMAQEIPPTERQVFLAKLEPKQELAVSVERLLRQDRLLADIDDWMSDVKAKMKHADDWEEADYYGWDGYYDDEDSLGPYKEFVEAVSSLLSRTRAAFARGNLPLARAAFEKLFGEALQLEDDYGRGVRADDLPNVDVLEERARYLRAIHETEPPSQRPQVLFEQMQQAQSWLAQPRPMLNDIIEISPKPLPDQGRFLSDWIALLRKQRGKDADAWLREAIRLASGTPGLEELARAEGKQRPRAYLDWVVALEEEKKPEAVIAAAQLAFQVLPARLPIRAAIADHLCAAAMELDQTESVRSGRWQAFIAKPTLARLLDLCDNAPTRDERINLMQQAAQEIRRYLAHPPRPSDLDLVWDTDDEEGSSRDSDSVEQPAWIDKSVLAHAYLFAGEWEQAHQLAAREKVLGWSESENPQGLVMPYFLVLLSRKPARALPRNLARVWQQALENSIGWEYGDESGQEENRLLKRLERAYGEVISSVDLDLDQQGKFLAWCLDVAKRRVNAIVGDQHRGSYGKAATLIAACAEVLRLQGNNEEARALLDQVRNRFPRHRAFQSELDAALPQKKLGRR
jgi:hypothetical protein